MLGLGSLAARIGLDTTTLTVCWAVTRSDGTIVRGTAHDAPIRIASGAYAGTYRAAAAVMSSDAESKSDGSVSNLEVQGAFQVDALIPDLTVADVEGGMYDQAPAVLLLVDWEQPDAGQKVIMRGTLGEFERDSDGMFRTEVRGLAQALSQQFTRTFSQRCDVTVFGDSRCKFDVAAQTRTGTVTAVESRKRFTVALDAGPAARSAVYYTGGKFTVTSGAMDGVAREVRATDVGAASEWQASTAYAVGARVTPVAGATGLLNPDFEEGDTGWTKGLWTIDQVGGKASGTWGARINDGGAGEHPLANSQLLRVSEGNSVSCTATTYCTGGQNGVGPADGSHVFLRLTWLGPDQSTVVDTTDGDYETEHSVFEAFTEVSVSGAAPAGAAYVRVSAVVDGNADFHVDAFELDYAYVPALAAEAQNAGTSGATEPTWPTSAGGTVVDGGITWEMIDADTAGAIAAEVLLWEELPDDPQVGDTFTLAPGCDRSYATCRHIFDNLVNFRGHGLYAVGKDALLRGNSVVGSSSSTFEQVTEEDLQDALDQQAAVLLGLL